MRTLIVDDNSTNLNLFKTILERRGFEVITAVNGEDALQLLKGDHVDIIVCNAALMSPPGEKMSEGYYEHIVRTFNTNALGEMRTAQFFLPLMKVGMKRLCFISTEAGSIIRMWRDSGYAYSISKTALNMGVRIMFNDLYRQGYTFRLYHPGHMMHTNPDGTYEKGADFPPEDSAAVAVPQFINDRDDESRLVMIDYLGNEWPY